MSDSVRASSLPVQPPYRLDLTATVLRRLSTNVVDVFDGTTYRRLIGDSGAPALLSVTQPAPDRLAVRVSGDAGDDAGALVARMLGTDVRLDRFTEAARSVAWLAPLVAAALGVRPPRYPTLWEAIVNAVVYQQISIHAAGAILRRIIERYEPLRRVGAVELAPFPRPHLLVDADPVDLRACGLSVNKVVALRRLGRAILDGELDAAACETLPTPELTAHLTAFAGIGPWTAAVIALRGFGRLDTFPLNDSGAARAFRDLSGGADIDVDAVLDALGPQRGMLYYHLLLGRLAARGEIALDASADGGARK